MEWRRKKKLHSQLFTKHNFVKKANVLRAIKIQLPQVLLVILSNMLLVKTTKTTIKEKKKAITN